jgi:hypothetical protein
MDYSPRELEPAIQKGRKNPRAFLILTKGAANSKDNFAGSRLPCWWNGWESRRI